MRKLVIFLPVLLFPIQLHAAESSIDCLTKNIYFEAKNQSTAGQLAVALVVMNRVKDKRFPDTVCDVIYEGPTYESWKTRQFPDLPKEKRKYYPRKNICQFSWYCDGKSDDPKEFSAINNAQWIAWLVLEGRIFDFTRGATHYHADYVDPKWNKYKQVDRIMQIDDHIFYRWD